MYQKCSYDAMELYFLKNRLKSLVNRQQKNSVNGEVTLKRNPEVKCVCPQSKTLSTCPPHLRALATGLPLDTRM